MSLERNRRMNRERAGFDGAFFSWWKLGKAGPEGGLGLYPSDHAQKGTRTEEFSAGPVLPVQELVLPMVRALHAFFLFLSAAAAWSMGSLHTVNILSTIIT